MLTRKQHELLLYIHDHIKEKGIPPSFDEMKDALDLASKSGIHRLMTALEERGFIHRLHKRARAVEILRMPEATIPSGQPRKGFSPSVIEGSRGKGETRYGAAAGTADSAGGAVGLPVMGRIAAGVPISAIQNITRYVNVPSDLLSGGEHYALEIKGDSMIEAGIFDRDTVIIKNTSTANPGEIVVALIDDEEVTLKRLRRKNTAIALEAANPDYETRIFRPSQVKIQGKLVGLIRRYH